MLNFVIDYMAPIQKITSNLDANLRQYELSLGEWETAKQLRDVLKVCYVFVYESIVALTTTF